MSNYHVHTAKFPFKRVMCKAGGVYNIPGVLVLSGHGYDLRSYMCDRCGSVVVIDHELLHWEKTDVRGLVRSLRCPSCECELEGSLTEHPQHVFHEGRALKIDETMDQSGTSVTEVLDVFTISKR
jgi:hypothetical protein